MTTGGKLPSVLNIFSLESAVVLKSGESDKLNKPEVHKFLISFWFNIFNVITKNVGIDTE